MSENNELVVSSKNELLDIFATEEDRMGTDLLNMSNYFDIFVSKIDTSLDRNAQWDVVINPGNLMGRLAAVIKGGFDIADMKMLVADTSHFSKEIVDGLKSGLYHIGESKEMAGNLRPAVLDEKEHLVKCVTLKRAINPTEVLSDMSNLSMQLSLKQISGQIEDVGRDVQGISEFIRRESLSNKFIYARDKIMLAATAEGNQREQFLIEADTYLMEGLTNLYADLNVEVKKLSDLKGPFRSLKAADTIMTNINEDMQMIPRYVGLRVYLFNLRGKVSDANRILGEFRFQLEALNDRTLEGGKYTALEMIHRYYPYGTNDMDFWIEQPPKMLEALKSYEYLIDQRPEELIYIDMEDGTDE